MRSLGLTALFASTLLAAPVAHAARTVAVLPLDKGAGSEEYDGLGLALAGMMTTDLSRVEALQLVERSRLDELLSEIELGEQGYLDPKTAATVGSGVGAELVVMGSYSVVGTTFLLDARLVDVAKSEIVEAADAHGDISDFVTVEKDLIDALIDDLAVEVSGGERRKIIAEAPTENFTAFSTYGRGLAAEGRGELDVAGERYKEALAADPEFAQARSALSGLRGRIEAMNAREAEARLSDFDKRLMKGLAAAPDPRELGEIPTDLVSTAQFAVRFQALHKLGRHCQRYEEMFAYGSKLGWNIDTPKKGKNSRRIERPSDNRTAPFFIEIILQAEASGMYPSPERYLSPPMNDDTGVSRTNDLFFDVGHFTIGYTQGSSFDGRGYRMFQSLLRCFPPDEQSEELAKLRKSVLDAGHGDFLVDATTYNAPLSDRFVALEAELAVRNGGMTDRIREDLDALLDRHPTDDRANELYPHMWAKRRVGDVVRAGEIYVREAEASKREAEASKREAERERLQATARARDERMRFGLTPAQFVDVWNALLADDDSGGVLRTDSPYCAWVVPDARRAITYFSPPASALAVSDLPARGALEATQVVRLVDFGCIAAKPGRVSSVDQAMALMRAGADEATGQGGDCHRGAMTMLQMADLNQPLLPTLPTDEIRFTIVSGMLQTYYNVLYLPGCTAE